MLLISNSNTFYFPLHYVQMGCHFALSRSRFARPGRQRFPSRFTSFRRDVASLYPALASLVRDASVLLFPFYFLLFTFYFFLFTSFNPA
jgi:hypothetical protein